MTPEKINIAIAEVCGFANCLSPHQDGYQFLTDRESGIAMGRPVGRTLPTGLFEPIPNYHGDLNAMHDAECIAFGDWGDYSGLWHQYETCLKQVCGIRNHWMSATAAQRAEAFLRVHNLWRE